jgi:hypothetical protein
MSDSNESVDVDLKKFELDFKREHDPVEKAILVLCSICHRKYDEAPKDALVVKEARLSISERPQRSYSKYDVLPISLNPARPDDFKAMLLERRKAVVEVLYEDGSVDRKHWNASRFNESSNVFSNLRSRPEFRKGIWQENGIVKVNVQVAE